MLNVNFKCCTVSLITFPALTFTVFPSQKISFMCLGEAGLKQNHSFLSQVDFSTGGPGCKWMMPHIGNQVPLNTDNPFLTLNQMVF